MSSRIEKALRKLGVKCVAQGTEVHGDHIDDIIECIADHFERTHWAESGTIFLGTVAGADKVDGSQGWKYITFPESLSTRFSNVKSTDTFLMKIVDADGVCVGIFEGAGDSEGRVLFSVNASYPTLKGMQFITYNGESISCYPYPTGGFFNLNLYTLEFYEVSTTYHRLDENYLPESVESVVIRSSTVGSTKKFKITVNDSGTITATEV